MSKHHQHQSTATAEKPSRNTEQRLQPTNEEIAQRAFEIYEASGCQEGHCQENWLQAEAELNGGHQTNGSTKQ